MRTLLSGAAGCAALAVVPAAHGDTFTYTRITSNTAGTPDQWSAGTNWNLPPVAGIDTILNFTGTLPAATTVFTNNDTGTFLLNQMSFTPAGPATGTAPTITVSGNALQFINNGATAPQLTFAATGTVLPTVNISAPIILTNTLNVTGASTGTLSGGISGPGGIHRTSTGAGTLVLSSANTYSGLTTVGTLNGGTNVNLVVTNGGALGSTVQGVVVNGTTNSGTGAKLQLGSGTTNATITGEMLTMATGTGNRSALSNNTTTGSSTWAGNIIVSGTGSAQFYGEGNGGQLVVGTSTSHTITQVAGSTAVVTMRGGSNTAAGHIINSTINLGTNTLSRTDSAIFTLNSPFGVWGPTNISTGTLKLGVDDALPQATTVTLGQGGTSAPTFDLNGRSQTVSGLSDSPNVGTATITSSVAGGVFTLNNAATVNFGNTGTTGIITGGANLSLVKLGAGNFSLNNKLVNTYTGSTTVNAGTLTLNFANLATPTNLLNSGSALVLGGGTLNITAKASAVTSQTMNGLTINAGGSTIVVNNAVTGTPDTLLALGAITRPVTGGTVAFVLPSNAQTATNGITTTTTPVNGILGGWATVGDDWATVSSGNIVANTAYTNTNRLGGTIASDAAANVRITEGGAAGNVTPAAPGTTDIHTLLQNAAGGTAVVDLASGDVLRLGAAGGVLLSSTAGPLTIGSAANLGTLTAGGAADTAGGIAFTNNHATNALTVNTTLSDNGTGALTVNKSGIGELVLNGANTYTGGTTLGGGTVTLGNTAALGNANNPLTVTAGSLNLNGNSIGVGNLAGTGGTIANNGTGTTATLTIGNNNATGGVFRGTIVDNTAGTGTVALTKVGTGTLVLAGANTYSGGTTISGGVLQVGSGGNSGTLGGGTVTNNASLVFNRSDAFTVANQITGSGGIAQNGRGTVTLSAAHSYAGSTSIGAGTLTLSGGNNRLPTGTTLAFTGAVGTLDVAGNSQTLASMTFPAGASNSAVLRGTAGGSVTINGSAPLQIGPGGALATNPFTTFDSTNLPTFTYNSSGSEVRVGLAVGASNTVGLGQVATANFGPSTNITASALNLASVSASSDGGAVTVNLGQASVLNVNSVGVGFSGRSDATLQFTGGLSNPSATLRGTAGGTSAVANFNVGLVSQFSGAGQVTFATAADFSGGTLDANVTNMLIGQADTGGAANRVGTVNASFSMGQGTLNVDTLRIGRITGAGGGTGATTFTANGTFTMSHAGGTLNATTITLAENTITTAAGASTRIVNGTFALVDGTVKATTIQRGAQTGNATATVAFNWTNGTIQNTDAADLTITNVPINITAGNHIFNATGTQTITVGATSIISGGASITKSGTGTLVLGAANTYGSGTTITGGTLLANTPGPTDSATGSGPVAVNSGGTLGGTGRAAGAVTISNGGAVAPGASVGTLTTGGQTWSGGGAYNWELTNAAAAGGTLAADPGAGVGWDLLELDTASINLTADSGTKFTINIARSGAALASFTDQWFTIAHLGAATTGNPITTDNILLNDPLLTPGAWSIRLEPDGGTGQLLQIQAVPEPVATLPILGTLALLTRRRRRAVSR